MTAQFKITLTLCSFLALALSACDESGLETESETRGAVFTLDEIDVTDGESVEFLKFGDGVLVGVKVAPDTPSSALTLIEELEATPLELYTTLVPGAPVPDELVANHQDLVAEGVAELKPRALPGALRSLSIWASTDCNGSSAWSSYWNSIYGASYETDVDYTFNSRDAVAQGQDDPGTSYVRLGMCHRDGPGATPPANFLLWASPTGVGDWVSSPVNLGSGYQARYYYYGSSNYYWVVASNNEIDPWNVGSRAVAFAQRTL